MDIKVSIHYPVKFPLQRVDGILRTAFSVDMAKGLFFS